MPDPLFLRSGDTLPGGKYVLVEPLGRGAMGVVFWAKDRHLNRDVALKFLSDQARRNPEIKLRFLREARALARIRNPHVVQVYEVSPDDAEELFIAMEYLVGDDLAARLAKGWRPSTSEAVNLVLQACDALAAAHREGVVHRDLKPSNLFVTRDGVLKVVDFGVSRILSEPRLTRTGEAIGTPYYMSPEQVRSEPQLDHRTDVWSLGVILYELTCGRRPFEGTSIGEVISGILGETPRTLLRRGVNAPPRLDEIVAKCLEKDPSRRFRDIDELTQTLRLFATELTPEPVQQTTQRLSNGSTAESPVTSPPTSAPSAPAPHRSHGAWYVLAGAVVGATLVSSLTAFVLWKRSNASATVQTLAAAVPAASSQLVSAAPPAPPLPEPVAALVESATPVLTASAARPVVVSNKPALPIRSAQASREANAHNSSAPAASSTAEHAPKQSWLPAQPAGAAISPYADAKP